MLTKNELKSTLKEVLSTQATSYEYQDTMEYLVYKAFDLGADDVEIDKHDNIYITKGKADVYPCVVAHTDTVHDIYKGYKVYEVEGNFVAFDSATMQQVGTGGDDKVGLWVCLEMLRSYDNIKICFFAQEEIGCVGSTMADAKFFDDVGYVFECDRKGNSDFVQTSSGVKMFGKKFKKAITKTLTEYNYKITDGGLTDVHEIAQIANIACANMSCGYYNPHSKQEFVNIDDAVHTCRLVHSLISTLGEVRYKHKAEDTYSGYLGGGWGYNYNSYGVSGVKTISSKPSKKVKVKTTSYGGCDVCGSLTTAGCDWCYKDEQPISKSKSKPCTCGGELTAYSSGSEDYRHCRDCGFYEDTNNYLF